MQEWPGWSDQGRPRAGLRGSGCWRVARVTWTQSSCCRVQLEHLGCSPLPESVSTGELWVPSFLHSVGSPSTSCSLPAHTAWWPPCLWTGWVGLCPACCLCGSHLSVLPSLSHCYLFDTLRGGFTVNFCNPKSHSVFH